MERTYEGVIVLTQSDEDRDLRVIGCLYCMCRRPHACGYVCDGTGVNQLRLLGPVPEIGALLLALTPSDEWGSKPHRTKVWMG